MDLISFSSLCLSPDEEKDKVMGCNVTFPTVDNANDNQLIILDNNTKISICKECYSIKTSKNEACPVCSPEKYFHNMIFQPKYNIFYNPSNLCSKNATIALVFDLGAERKSVDQIINVFVTQKIPLNNCRFSLAFITSVPIFVTNSSNILNISFGDATDLLFCSNEELPKILDEVNSIIKSIHVKYNRDSNAISDFFTKIQKTEVDNVIIFYSKILKVPERISKIQVHAIEVTEGICNDPLSLFNRISSHNVFSKTSTNIIEYITHIVKPSVFGSFCEFTLTTSQGLKPKWAFISGTIYSGELQHVVIPNSDFFITFKFCGHKKPRNYALQFVYNFSNGCFFIQNRMWIKAQTVQLWISSISFYDYVSLMIRQFIFKSYSKKLKISTFKKKLFEFDLKSDFYGLSGVRIVIKIFSFFCGCDQSLIPQNVRNEIIFLCLTMGMNYMKELIDALMNLVNIGEFIEIPPFFISYDIGLMKCSKRNSCVISPVFFMLEKEHFMLLKEELNKCISDTE